MSFFGRSPPSESTLWPWNSWGRSPATATVTATATATAAAAATASALGPVPGT